jgi:hypothetical protein
MCLPILVSKRQLKTKSYFRLRINFNYPMQRPPMQRRMPFQGPRHFNNGRGGGGGGGGGPYYRNDQNFNKNFNRSQDGGRNWDQNRRR